MALVEVIHTYRDVRACEHAAHHSVGPFEHDDEPTWEGAVEVFVLEDGVEVWECGLGHEHEHEREVA